MAQLCLSRFEMNRMVSSKVDVLPCERISLETDLRSVWRWLKYLGLCPDLLLISVKQHRWLEMTRFLFTWFIVLLVSAFGVHQLVQLVVKSWSMDKMVETVPNLNAASFCLCTILFRYQMWSRLDEILELFNDWKQIEMESKHVDLVALKRITKAFYISITVNFIVSMIICLAWNVMDPHNSLFITHYRDLRDSMGLHSLYLVNGFIVGFCCLIWVIDFLIPIIFFYHVAIVVGSLAEEWDAQLRNEEYLRSIWQKYEKILHLVDRANKLFGPHLATCNLFLMVSLCFSAFGVIQQFQNSMMAVEMISGCLFFVGMILIFNWTLSQVFLSLSQLQKSLADELSQKWFQLGEAERLLLVSFLARLDKGDMAVRPMNLFTICPSNLLGMLAVVMNYFVVLAQLR